MASWGAKGGGRKGQGTGGNYTRRGKGVGGERRTDQEKKEHPSARPTPDGVGKVWKAYRNEKGGAPERFPERTGTARGRT